MFSLAVQTNKNEVEGTICCFQTFPVKYLLEKNMMQKPEYALCTGFWNCRDSERNAALVSPAGFLHNHFAAAARLLAKVLRLDV